LSIPGVRKKMKRPLKVKVKCQDRIGIFYTLEATDLLARAVCHEVDHLNGVLFIDNCEPDDGEVEEDE
jgi:peptide deformylase